MYNLEGIIAFVLPFLTHETQTISLWPLIADEAARGAYNILEGRFGCGVRHILVQISPLHVLGQITSFPYPQFPSLKSQEENLPYVIP